MKSMIAPVGAPGVKTSATQSALSSGMSCAGIVPPKVTWKWVGRDMHNVAVSKGPVKFNSSFKKSGTYSRTMRKRGTYKIICTIHQPDMRMTLKVVR